MRHGSTAAGGDGFALLAGLAGFSGTLVLIALVAVLVAVAVRRRQGLGLPLPAVLRRGRPALVPSAVQVLDERLARGDIDINDYVTRRAALTGGAPEANTWRPAPADGTVD